MTAAISNGALSASPKDITGYASTREARNIAHVIIGQSEPAVTFKPAGLRTGTLQLLVDTLADALAVEAVYTATGIVTLTDTDLPLLNMQHVATGNLTVALDDATHAFWTVAVDYTEVV